jgi:hypothetical protein
VYCLHGLLHLVPVLRQAAMAAIKPCQDLHLHPGNLCALISFSATWSPHVTRDADRDTRTQYGYAVEFNSIRLSRHIVRVHLLIHMA